MNKVKEGGDRKGTHTLRMVPLDGLPVASFWVLSALGSRPGRSPGGNTCLTLNVMSKLQMYES